MNEFDKEKLIEKDMKAVENRIRHAFNQGYEAGLKHGKKQEPFFWEKCPYYEADMMFDGKDEYDMGQCKYKQEPIDDILDKIKAEIRKQNIADFIAVQSVLEIIDKYKAENEE